MSDSHSRAVTIRRIDRLIAGRTDIERDREDALAVEEPLEIRIAGDTLAVTMRTPGQDRQLAIGFAFAEGILESIDDVGRVYHCGKPGEPGAENVIELLPGPGSHLDPDVSARNRRGTLVTSACGVCGRQTIEDLLQRCQPLDNTERFPIALVLESTEKLSRNQTSFDATGATHAALALDGSGTPLANAEDVGRHNAVDKVVGSLLLDGRLSDARLLVVSGRVSFEIIQKATMARIPLVVGVSAPTSLAVDLATEMGITLAAFARGDAVNLYSHPDRIDTTTR